MPLTDIIKVLNFRNGLAFMVKFTILRTASPRINAGTVVQFKKDKTKSLYSVESCSGLWFSFSVMRVCCELIIKDRLGNMIRVDSSAVKPVDIFGKKLTVL